MYVLTSGSPNRFHRILLAVIMSRLLQWKMTFLWCLITRLSKYAWKQQRHFKTERRVALRLSHMHTVKLTSHNKKHTHSRIGLNFHKRTTRVSTTIIMYNCSGWIRTNPDRPRRNGTFLQWHYCSKITTMTFKAGHLLKKNDHTHTKNITSFYVSRSQMSLNQSRDNYAPSVKYDD